MKFFASFAICFLAAGMGSVLTRPAISSWYATLNKPPWTPPNWLFAPAWATLFAMMAVAAGLVWQRSTLDALPMKLFGLQLGLNVGWSALFFAWHRPKLALLEIVVLWCAILATMLQFLKVAPLAGWLLLPYLLWVGFAAALNFSIVLKNRG